MKAKVSATTAVMWGGAMFEVYGMFQRNGSGDPVQQGSTVKPVAIKSQVDYDVDFGLGVAGDKNVYLLVATPSLQKIPWLITLEVDEIVGTP